MITITPGAAEQIRRAAATAEAGSVLRVAARRMPDGSIDYGMGFDEWREGDVRVLCEGVALVVAAPSRTLLKGVTLDFVEVAPGELRFIFAARDGTAAAAGDPA
jgi:iron-sulfur cluster assembly protein